LVAKISVGGVPNAADHILVAIVVDPRIGALAEALFALAVDPPVEQTALARPQLRAFE
jgi:hypothetical protein